MLTIGSFLLAAELFCSQVCLGASLLTARAFLLTVRALLLAIELLAYSGKVCLKRTDSRQRSSTVSKKHSNYK